MFFSKEHSILDEDNEIIIDDTLHCLIKGIDKQRNQTCREWRSILDKLKYKDLPDSIK